MARDGSGTFTLPYPDFVAGTTISSSQVDANNSDISDALTASIAKDGQTTPTANLPMGGFRHTGVGNASARTDYAASGQVQDSAFIECGSAGGTADALTLSPTPAITAYAAGQRFQFTAAASNTGAATITVSGLTAKAIQANGNALAAGNIENGKRYDVTYDGTQFQLQPASIQMTSAGRALLDDADAATQRATLGTVNDPGSNGLLSRTGANTTAARTITGTANQVTVANGNGVSGNPTLSLPQDIATTSSPTFAEATLDGVAIISSLRDWIAGPERVGAATGIWPALAVYARNFIGQSDPLPFGTFSRASTAYYRDANGILKSAASGTIRLDWEPSTGQLLGWLIEEARTSLLTYSEQFDNAAWTKTTATISANATTAPDGASTADKLTPNTGGAGYVYQNKSFTSGTTYTYSVWAKAAEFDELVLLAQSALFTDATNRSYTFDLTAGTATVGTGTGHTATIETYPNGWHRCTMTFTPDVTTTNTVQVRVSLTGDGTSGVYVWGAQQEAGAFASSYIKTEAATATRAADVWTESVANFAHNSLSGTLYVKASVAQVGTSGFPGSLCLYNSGGASADRISLFVSDGGLDDIKVDIRVGGSSVVNIGASTATAGTSFRSAVGFEENIVDFAANGTLGTRDTSASIPTVDTLQVGVLYAGAGYLNGHVSEIAYFARRQTSGNVQEITE